MSCRRADLAPEYRALWTACTPVELVRIQDAVNRVWLGRDRYGVVEEACGVPWWFAGILHDLESGGRFDRHLHNGDPLAQRTFNVPSGRPMAAAWTWESSAVDALTLKGWDRHNVLRGSDGAPDWSLPTTLWRFEVWNGFGYRARGIRTPYLWAASNHEQPGRYVRDGVWDATARSAQVGAAVLLKAMIAQDPAAFEFPPWT